MASCANDIRIIEAPEMRGGNNRWNLGYESPGPCALLQCALFVKKEIPVWAGLILGLLFGIALVLMGAFTPDRKVRLYLVVMGSFVGLISLAGGISWGWYIYKGKLGIKDIRKSVEQIDREAEKALREAQELIEKSRTKDPSKLGERD
jgi:hypothetical protein